MTADVEVEGLAIGAYNGRDEAALIERRERAVSMKARGMSYRAIGRALGISQTVAREDVLNTIREECRDNEAVAKVRAMQVRRHELIVERFWPLMWGRPPKGDDPGEPPDEGAANVIMRATMNQAELLGTKAPERIEVDTRPLIRFVLDGAEIIDVTPEQRAIEGGSDGDDNGSSGAPAIAG